jgi:hypothetical protein
MSTILVLVVLLLLGLLGVAGGLVVVPLMVVAARGFAV